MVLTKKTARPDDVALWKQFLENGHALERGVSWPSAERYPFFNQQYTEYKKRETDKATALALINEARKARGDPPMALLRGGKMPPGVGVELKLLSDAGVQLSKYAKKLVIGADPDVKAKKAANHDVAAERAAVRAKRERARKKLVADATDAGKVVKLGKDNRVLAAAKLAAEAALLAAQLVHEDA